MRYRTGSQRNDFRSGTERGKRGDRVTRVGRGNTPTLSKKLNNNK